MQLDKLFNKYNEEKRAKLEAEKKQQAVCERNRQRAAEIIELLVLPVFRRVSEAIRSHGFDSEVRESSIHPNVELTFSLDRIFVSRLSATGSGENLSLHRRIKNEQGEEYSVTERIPLAAVSERAVEENAEAFVRSVLEKGIQPSKKGST